MLSKTKEKKLLRVLSKLKYEPASITLEDAREEILYILGVNQERADALAGEFPIATERKNEIS